MKYVNFYKDDATYVFIVKTDTLVVDFTKASYVRLYVEYKPDLSVMSVDISEAVIRQWLHGLYTNNPDYKFPKPSRDFSNHHIRCRYYEYGDKYSITYYQSEHNFIRFELPNDVILELSQLYPLLYGE